VRDPCSEFSNSARRSPECSIICPSEIDGHFVFASLVLTCPSEVGIDRSYMFAPSISKTASMYVFASSAFPYADIYTPDDVPR
jgi:hypothetical protein